MKRIKRAELVSGTGSRSNDCNVLYESNLFDVPMTSKTKSINQTLEAQIREGDTLQAIALRFNCTVSALKRLNKIEKDIEIHARKAIKVPITAHSILLQTEQEDLPIVHKSGQSSPKTSGNALQRIFQHEINERLLVAAVSLSVPTTNGDHSFNTTDCKDELVAKDDGDININKIIMNSEASQCHTDDNGTISDNIDDETDHLLLGNEPHAIRRPAATSDLSCSGSDCDISWICLFVCILAMCFAIPLIYILYIAEHIEKYHHSSS